MSIRFDRRQRCKHRINICVRMRQVYCLGNLQETPSRRVDGQSSENTMETAFGVSSSGNAAQTVDTPSPPSSKTTISKIIPVLKNKTKAKIVELNVL